MQAAREEDNRALAAAGMPYRYDDAGYARCVICCGQYYFRADRPGQPDCEHYDPFHEDIRPLGWSIPGAARP